LRRLTNISINSINNPSIPNKPSSLSISMRNTVFPHTSTHRSKPNLPTTSNHKARLPIQVTLDEAKPLQQRPTSIRLLLQLLKHRTALTAPLDSLVARLNTSKGHISADSHPQSTVTVIVNV
jgi:hypothetical protein